MGEDKYRSEYGTNGSYIDDGSDHYNSTNIDRSFKSFYINDGSDHYNFTNIDNKSEKVDKGLGSTSEKARDDAWKRAKHNS